MVIGLTGPNASGKGEAARYLKEKGFECHSLSDILREEADRSGIEPVRENLIRLGNDMRREKGPAVLAIRAIKKLSGGKNHIVDSIRNPAEIEAFRGVKGFTLIGIDAPAEIRFKRSLERGRSGDALTLEEFIEKEEKENRSSAENQQLKKCLGMADIVLTNDSTVNELRKKIDEAIKKA